MTATNSNGKGETMKRNEAIKRINQIRESVKHGQPHNLAFVPGIRDRELAQVSLDDSYKLWSETWILPVLDELEDLIVADAQPRQRKIAPGCLV